MKKSILQTTIRRKMSLFGHVTRMGDDRKLKKVVFGVMERKNKRKSTQRLGGRHTCRKLGRGHTAHRYVVSILGPLPGSDTPMVRHSQGLPLPGGITTTRLRTFRLRHFVYRHFVYIYFVYYDFPC